jgi:hypothetical protein
MLNSALEGETPRLFADADPLARCIYCGRPRPLELMGGCVRAARKSRFWSCCK